jgi:hypothetical protein
MKRLFRWIFRAFLILLVLAVLLIIFILNPQVLYAHEMNYKNTTVYSEQPYPSDFNHELNQSLQLISYSELYDSSFRFDVFLNDGSSFPSVPTQIWGDAFAWGYHNNVVLNGTSDSSFGFIYRNGYKRRLSRTIAHEMIHCLEAKRFGLFGSRPFKNIPYWKWEGYPEYIAYWSSLYNEDSLLMCNLRRLDSLKNETYAPVEVDTEEGKSFAGLDYFRWWLMIKYCIDIKKMSFKNIMKDEVKYDAVYSEMMSWYAGHRSSFSPPQAP